MDIFTEVELPDEMVNRSNEGALQSLMLTKMPVPALNELIFFITVHSSPCWWLPYRAPAGGEKQQQTPHYHPIAS